VRVLVVGSGGREHALALALSRDADVAQVHIAPGNPGAAEVAEQHGVDANDGVAVAARAKAIGADLVVVGPEAPLVAGVADAVREAGIACFGPSRAAALLEGSKAYAKQVMAAADVPTARSLVCETATEVEQALDAFGPPYVVKDDGLAAGKGVVVTDSRERAAEHGNACTRVVIEEFLAGPEVSVFALTDGATVVPLRPAQDFKRLQDGDSGPNTGGMGAYTPLPWAPPGLVEETVARVLQPTVDEMARRGAPFTGLLYAGLALTPRGLQVVEFNVRFGDPETQALLALLRTPLGSLLHTAGTGRLDGAEPLSWHAGAAVSVVVAAAGYPEAPRTGDEIIGVAEAAALEGVDVLQAGTAMRDGRLVTAGGRVLAVTAVGADLAQARERAYAGVGCIAIAGSHARSDIAQAAAGQ
jgi:phosphoribosylamine--glycine ligase